MTFEEFEAKLKRLQEIQYFEQDEQMKFQEQIGTQTAYSSAFIISSAYNCYLKENPELVEEGRKLVEEIAIERERQARIISDAHEQNLKFYSESNNIFSN